MSSLSVLSQGRIPNRTPFNRITHGYLLVPDTEVPAGGGGIYGGARRLVRADVLLRDYRRKEKRQGMRTAEITPRKLFEALPKDQMSAKLTEIAQDAGVSKKAARELLAARLQIEITRARIERVEQLNQKTLALILAAVMADE